MILLETSRVQEIPPQAARQCSTGAAWPQIVSQGKSAYVLRITNAEEQRERKFSLSGGISLVEAKPFWEKLQSEEILTGLNLNQKGRLSQSCSPFGAGRILKICWWSDTYSAVENNSHFSDTSELLFISKITAVKAKVITLFIKEKGISHQSRTTMLCHKCYTNYLISITAQTNLITVSLVEWRRNLNRPYLATWSRLKEYIML